MVLRSVYEDTVSIYPHLSRADNPLALVTFFPAEDNSTNSLLEDSINSFPKTNIREAFGISYLEYISLPREICTMMLKSASAVLKDKNKQIENVLSDIE
jgi:hypothetical protein